MEEGGLPAARSAQSRLSWLRKTELQRSASSSLSSWLTSLVLAIRFLNIKTLNHSHTNQGKLELNIKGMMTLLIRVKVGEQTQ